MVRVLLVGQLLVSSWESTPDAFLVVQPAGMSGTGKNSSLRKEDAHR